jgi:hypothetical protein
MNRRLIIEPVGVEANKSGQLYALFPTKNLNRVATIEPLFLGPGGTIFSTFRV